MPNRLNSYRLAWATLIFRFFLVHQIHKPRVEFRTICWSAFHISYQANISPDGSPQDFLSQIWHSKMSLYKKLETILTNKQGFLMCETKIYNNKRTNF